MFDNSLEFIIKASKGWSIEITPSAAKRIIDFSKILKIGTKVNVTHLPGTSPIETIETSKQLYEQGMLPVPHLAVRSIQNLEALEILIKQLSEKAKIKEILIIAGSINKPVGDLYESMQVLNSGLIQKYGINKVGIAGHPEGSPDISDIQLELALKKKNEWAQQQGLDVYIETQFAFDSKPVLEWEKIIRENGNTLPIHVGIPGPATIKTLLKFAISSGIGPSLQMIKKQSKNITRLFTTQSPDKYIYGLARGMEQDKECLIKNFHFYPFGGFLKTVEWASALEKGFLRLDDSKGFEVFSNT